VLDRRELVAGEPSRTGAALTPDLTPKTVDGITVALDGPETIRAGEPARFAFTLTRDGAPVTDLAPYLGAAAHVAIVSEDASDFAHTHGEAVGTASPGDDGHPVPAAFGPEVRVEHAFPKPGRYKLWVQIGHDGKVLTVPFAAEAR